MSLTTTRRFYLLSRKPDWPCPGPQYRIADRITNGSGRSALKVVGVDDAKGAEVSQSVEAARAAYESFFALTKNADAGLPLATDARREFSLLK
jgi:hypothetical protein